MCAEPRRISIGTSALDLFRFGWTGICSHSGCHFYVCSDGSCRDVTTTILLERSHLIDWDGFVICSYSVCHFDICSTGSCRDATLAILLSTIRFNEPLLHFRWNEKRIAELRQERDTPQYRSRSSRMAKWRELCRQAHEDLELGGDIPDKIRFLGLLTLLFGVCVCGSELLVNGTFSF